MDSNRDITAYTSILSGSLLFQDIPEDHIPVALNFLNASIRHYEKDELIQRLGDPINRSGIVLEGTVEGSFLSDHYNKINMNHFTAGQSFAEALTLNHTNYSPIQLRALTKCAILFLQLDRILNLSSSDCAYEQILTRNTLQLLAGQCVFSNQKLRIANQKSMRDKILLYLHTLAPDTNGYLHIPFTQTALAEFLGVNRSAMSRELGRMQDEGILFIDGRSWKLQ